MLKRRIAIVEKRLSGLCGPTKKNFRIVYQFDGALEPEKGRDEELLVVRVVNTRGEDEAKKHTKGGR